MFIYTIGERFMCALTFVSPARAMILLNMELQTKYAAMQETVPSVPETVKKNAYYKRKRRVKE